MLLILVGALGATMLVLRAGDRVEAIQLTADIKAGESITDDNIKSVMVNDDSGANFVAWSQRAGLMKLQAKSTLYKGTVVVGEMFADKTAMEEGKVTVGVSLKEGQYPKGLDSGDNVAVYRVGNKSSGSGDQGGASGSAGASNSLLVERAVVVAADGSSGDSLASTNLPVTLTVDADDAAALTQAASAGEVAVVLIPGN
ncbi:SAF domain-containing protein OS=Streptomyces tendae OX=1932 GN=GUR47_18010 PE=4 SV=1 [Streptomyces tendae]